MKDREGRKRRMKMEERRNAMNAYPTPTADMVVPRKANVRMDPKLRKKFSC